MLSYLQDWEDSSLLPDDPLVLSVESGGKMGVEAGCDHLVGLCCLLQCLPAAQSSGEPSALGLPHHAGEDALYQLDRADVGGVLLEGKDGSKVRDQPGS